GLRTWRRLWLRDLRASRTFLGERRVLALVDQGQPTATARYNQSSWLGRHLGTARYHGVVRRLEPGPPGPLWWALYLRFLVGQVPDHWSGKRILLPQLTFE